MSSLKAQLSALASTNPDAGRLNNLSRRDSYIYSPWQAAKLTLDQVHQIGVDGMQQLLETDHSFQRFNHPLFGEASKRIDRTLLDPDQGKELSTLIEDFLTHLAPHLLNKPSAHVLEWLVRRFRIHEFDVEVLVSIFLPYHATPQFLAMLNIIRLDSHPHLDFLKPVQSSRSGLPQKHLANALLKTPDLLRYVTGILPSVTKRVPAHQALLGFHLTTFLGLFKAISSRTGLAEPFPQPVLAAVLPGLLEGLKSEQLDLRLTNLIIISAMAQASALPNEIITSLAKFIIEGHPTSDSGDIKAVSSTPWQEHDEAMLKTLVMLFQNSPNAAQLRLSSKSCHSLAKIPKVAELMFHLTETVDLSAFWSILIKGLIKSALKNETPSEELLVRLAQLLVHPTQTTELTITELFSPLLSMEVPARPVLRPLGIFFQRHPHLVETVAQRLLSEDRPEIKEAIASILRLLSGDLPLSSDKCDLALLQLSSSSAILRQDALRTVLKNADAQSPGASGQSIQVSASTVKTALMDPDPAVSECLFSFPHVIMKTIDPNDVLTIAHSTLRSSKTSRSTLKHWFVFLTGPFLRQHRGFAARVAEDIVLDRIFWTKSCAKATSALWAHDHDFQIWLGTVLEGVWPMTMPSESSEDRVATNETVLDRISENVLKLGDLAVIALLQKLQKGFNPEAPLARVVPLLVLWRTATRLSGAMIGMLINTLIDHMVSSTDSAGFQRWASMDTSEGEADRIILEGFYSKSSSEKLASRIAAETLRLAVSQAHKLERTEYCWFEPGILDLSSPIPPSTSISQTSDLAKLHFKLYSFGHSGDHQNAQSLARRILLTLHQDILKEECLTFLARIWTSSAFNETFRAVALLDAAAEVKANGIRCKKTAEMQRKDYQILIPSLLIALTDPLKAVRSAAIQLVNSLRKYPPPADLDNKNMSVSPQTAIYAYDRFYGIKASADLQYLPTAEATQFINLIYDSKTEILLDGLGQIRTLLQSISPKQSDLASSGGKGPDKKSVAECFKRKIVCFLMKVITCWDDFGAKVKLLKCLSNVSDAVRLQYVAPLVDQMVLGSTQFTIGGQSVSRKDLQEYASLLLQAYDVPGKAFTSGKDLPAYDVFVRALQCSATSGPQRAIVEAAIQKLQDRLFVLLSATHKQDILRRVLALSSSTHDNVGIYVIGLRNLPLDTTCFTVTLSSIAKDISSNSARSHKKTKTSKGSVGKASSGAPDLSKLTMLLETISVEKFEPNFELFTALLDTLTTLLAAHAAHELDIQFPAQMLVGFLVAIAPNLKAEQFKSDGLQLASIVDYMRISLDPHVSQQAILLLAELARLCPEQTCQIMMPIFTFVGTHVIQRDDAFSARVVDKAIQALIPPMVEVARASGGSRIELILSLRELLLMFVGARSHIPKHRRTRLFVHLIKVLGDYNFLGALLMLIIDADINEVAGGSNFELVLSIWESFPAALGAAAMAHVAAEVETLLGQSPSDGASILPLKSPENDLDADGDQIIHDGSEQLNTTRVRVLMQFMADALGSKSLSSKLHSARSTNNTDGDQVLSYLMIQVLEISQPYTEPTDDEQAQDARVIARKVAKLVSLPFLSRALLPKIKDTSNKLVSCTLDLLRTRLPLVKPAHRVEIESCVKEAVTTCEARIREGLTISPKDERLPLLYAIETVVQITGNSTASEQSLLSQVYAPLLNIARDSQDARITCATLSLLKQLCQQLGSRLIPQVRGTICTCRDLAQKITDPESSSTSSEVISRSFNLIQAAVETSPSFVLPHMSIILEISARWRAVKQRVNDSVDASQESLVRSLSKTVRLRDLEPALSTFWSKMKVTQSSVLTLMDILQRAIKYATVSEVITSSKAIFNLLLEIFDLRKQQVKVLSMDELAKIESNASSMFLSMVLKLNDEALKPLLFRLIDWATVDLLSGDDELRTARGIALYSVFGTLLTHLQSLAVPYFTHLVDNTVTVLNAYSQGSNSNFLLWSRVAAVVEQTLVHDSEGFWNLTRLSKITKPITSQLKLSSQFTTEQFSTRIRSLIGQLARQVASHDTLLKVLNSGVLEELKSSEDTKVKLMCLEVLEEMWQEIGTALVPFVPETVGGALIEALEESEGGVDQAAKKVVNRIELELGESIEGYLA